LKKVELSGTDVLLTPAPQPEGTISGRRNTAANTACNYWLGGPGSKYRGDVAGVSRERMGPDWSSIAGKLTPAPPPGDPLRPSQSDVQSRVRHRRRESVVRLPECWRTGKLARCPLRFPEIQVFSFPGPPPPCAIRDPVDLPLDPGTAPGGTHSKRCNSARKYDLQSSAGPFVCEVL